MRYFKSCFLIVTFAFHFFTIFFQPVISNPYRVKANRVRTTNGMTAINIKSNHHKPYQPKNRPGNTGKHVSEPENLEPIPDDYPEVNNDTSIENDPVTLRILSSMGKVWKDSRSDLLQKTIDLTKIASYTFSLSNNEFQLNFIGSQIFGCIARIQCNFITIPNRNDFFVVSDGFGGELAYLRSMYFNGPRKPTQQATDLYVRYKGKSPDTKCTVKCITQDPDRIRDLPLDRRLSPYISPSCKCGIGTGGRLDSRVVGGQTATPFEFPYQIAVLFKGTRKSACGASLINDRYALSAGHCWYNRLKAEEIEVLLHAHLLDQYIGKRPKLNNTNIVIPGYDLPTKTDKDEQSLRIQVAEVINHPLFDIDTADYDLALLRFKEKIDFSKYPNIRPVCLESWTAETEYKGKSAVLTGWGLADENAEVKTRLLQKLTMPMSDYNTCVRVNTEVLNITERMICGGYINGGKDACNGDSGGPLAMKRNGQFFQIGVVSYGDGKPTTVLLNLSQKGCARKGRLGIYSNVGEMAQWIYRIVHSDATWCKS